MNANSVVRPRVLIVDDNPMSTRLIESCLRNHGCETTIVTKAESAVVQMSEEIYDLVVLDWMMPDMNGSETLLAADAKSNAVTKAKNLMPVFTYSGKSENEIEIPECKNFEVLGHISKTVSYSELRRLMSGILQALRLI